MSHTPFSPRLRHRWGSQTRGLSEGVSRPFWILRIRVPLGQVFVSTRDLPSVGGRDSPLTDSTTEILSSRRSQTHNHCPVRTGRQVRSPVVQTGTHTERVTCVIIPLSNVETWSMMGPESHTDVETCVGPHSESDSHSFSEDRS